MRRHHGSGNYSSPDETIGDVQLPVGGCLSHKAEYFLLIQTNTTLFLPHVSLRMMNTTPDSVPHNLSIEFGTL